MTQAQIRKTDDFFARELRKERLKNILFDVYRDELTEIIWNRPGEGFNSVSSLGLIHRQCFGCQFDCGSQRDHDICLLGLEQVVEELIEHAIGECDEGYITHEFKRRINESVYFDHPLPQVEILEFICPVWRRDNLFRNGVEYDHLKNLIVMKRHLQVTDTEKRTGERKA